MRIRSMLTVLIVSAVLGGVALAVPPGRTPSFDKSPMGRITSYNVCYTKLLRYRSFLQTFQ